MAASIAVHMKPFLPLVILVSDVVFKTDADGVSNYMLEKLKAVHTPIEYKSYRTRRATMNLEER